MNKAKGFTIIELLIVTGLIGMLAAFVIPQMKNFTKRQSLTAAVNEIISEIQYTQTMASSGVQGNTEHVSEYRFSLSRETTDNPNYYRGFSVSAIDDLGFVITPALVETEYLCPICIISSQQDFDYKVPTGKLNNIGSNEFQIGVCYPDQGSYQIRFDINGRVFHDEFFSGSCTCQRSCD